MPTEAQHEVQKRADLNYYHAPRRVTDIVSDGCWSGRRCFIIGGGESLKGFNFSQLDDELTIGVNKSFVYYDSSILFFSDTNFYQTMSVDETLAPLWHNLQAKKISPVSQAQGMTFHDTYVIRRTNTLDLPQSLDEGINVWNNSGFGALVLAYLLGANPIYLLGFDLKCTKSTHWHCGYPGQTLEGQRNRMHAFMTPFVMTADAFKRNGTHVVNLNPDSALPCYHKTTINKIL